MRHALTSIPGVPFLVPEALQPDASIGVDFHQRITIVFRSRTFDHGHESAVVDPSDLVQVVLMAMPLKDGYYVPCVFEDLANLTTVFDTMVVAHIQSLVSEHDRLFVIRF